MDPICCEETFATDVRVTSVCCLTAACISSSSPCIVVLHPEILLRTQKAESTHWPLSALLERTSFADACAEGEVAPRWGAVYLPEVVVHKNEFGEPHSPVRVPVLIASPPWIPKNNVDSASSFR